MAIPSALWKEAWRSSIVKLDGSVVLAVHVIVVEAPVTISFGSWSVKAETSGTTKVKIL